MLTVRGKFARVCGEIDLDNPRILFVSVMGHIQLYEYEGLHQICFGCGQYGHKDELCPKLHSENNRVPEVTITAP